MKLKNLKTFISEARRNPDQNPKISAYEYLSKWKNDPDAYISMTAIDKIGINPQSKYNTPLGIYTYPLQKVWIEYDLDKSKNLIELPFAGEQPHVWVVTPKNKKTFINDLYTEYGSDKFDKDEQTLENIYKNFYHNSKPIATPSYSQEVINANWDHVYNIAKNQRKHKSSAGFFWFLSKLVAEDMAGSTKGLSMATKWNWILRQCGYSGFADKSGIGLIHSAEPIQAVFLSKDAFTVLGETYNKAYDGTRPTEKLEISKLSDLTSFVLNELDSDEDRVSIIEYVIFGNGMNLNVFNKVKMKKNLAFIWDEATYQDFKQLLMYIKAELALYIVQEHSKKALDDIYDALNKGMRDTL